MKSARWLRGIAVWSALAIAALLLVLLLATVVPIGTLSVVATLVVPGLLSWIVVAGVLLAGIGLVFRRGAQRRAAWVTAAAGATTAAFAITLTAVLATTIVAAGGTVDLSKTLAVGSVASGHPDARVPYRTVDGTTLEMSVYSPAKANSQAAPIVYYIHGGGWITGTADQSAADLRRFADAGYLVLSVEYRLADAQHATWDAAPNDVACGLAWTATHAREWGGDPTKIVVAGDSAGGNLALNLAYGITGERVSSAECTAGLPIPVGVAVQYPVADPAGAVAAAAGKTFASDGTDPRIFTDRYIGGTPAAFPERVDAISSRSYIGPDAPPTLILSPDSDALIPPVDVRSFASAAQARGVDVTLVRIPFSNHATDAVVRNGLPNQAHLSITLDFLNHITSR